MDHAQRRRRQAVQAVGQGEVATKAREPGRGRQAGKGVDFPFGFGDCTAEVGMLRKPGKLIH